MRQTGFLAASAAYALTYNFPKLATVHDLARKLEHGLLELGVEVTGSAETCMVRPPSNYSEQVLINRSKQGLL
jgi:threonine aldolase